jgi:prepilin signal peptidase PulO-like enzyme (type II secretory pathway)
VIPWWRGFVSREVARVRRDGRPAVLWSLRITVAATASYVVGSLLFPGTQPLLAPLTAMLVVQVTPLSLLASGLDRVIAVVAGVVLAVGFATVVPLEWWSLGLLILVSITIGQFLRLRSNLVEVAISAMLVLGVGSIGAEAAAWQRIAETLVGAAVGILATLAFPPKVATADAGRAIDGLADAVSELLVRAAKELDDMAEEHRGRLPGAAREWLDDARRITHDIPQVGAALLKAEEGRRLNVRAVGAPHVEPGLRQGLEALEHAAVSIRGLMRSVKDCADESWLADDSATAVLHDLARTFRDLAAAVDAFGELVRNEADVQTDVSLGDIARLQWAQDGMHRSRDRLDAALTAHPSADVVELLSASRATVRRMEGELALDERVRRQLRLAPPRRRHHRPGPQHGLPADAPSTATGPDDETVVLPRVPDEPPETRRGD